MAHGQIPGGTSEAIADAGVLIRASVELEPLARILGEATIAVLTELMRLGRTTEPVMVGSTARVAAVSQVDLVDLEAEVLGMDGEAEDPGKVTREASGEGLPVATAGMRRTRSCCRRVCC